ncbi:MAG: LD-carboxypeptidase [Actinobacteria bacterium]|nr:LD-carboxypeptidase [Actinomycetota bacterium]
MISAPVRAPALAAGDRVAVVAPSGPILDEGAVRAGLDVLASWDLDAVLMPHLHAQVGHLAGTDGERAADLNAAIRDPSIRAIWAVRGGYGAGRIVDLVRWQSLREDPKLLLGFSDVTALLVAAWERTGLITIHAPSVSGLAGVVGTAGEAHLRRLVSATEAPGEVVWASTPPTSLHDGRGAGRLVGGNLAMLCSLLGTVDEPDTRGTIVFLEEVGEPPYRIDRMLIQLLRAGLLDEVEGLVIGRHVRCDPAPGRASLSADEVVADVLGGLGIPTIVDAPIGHHAGQFALPLGVRATLDADTASLTLHEPAVS